MGDVLAIAPSERQHRRAQTHTSDLELDRFLVQKDRVLRYSRAGKTTKQILVATFAPWPTTRLRVHTADGKIEERFHFQLRRGSLIVAEIHVTSEELSEANLLRRMIVTARGDLVIEARESDQLRACFQHMLGHAIRHSLLSEVDAAASTGWVNLRDGGWVYVTRGACIGAENFAYVGPLEKHLVALPEPDERLLAEALKRSFLTPISQVNTASVSLIVDLTWTTFLVVRAVNGGRAPHFLILGTTGVGKTVLARHLTSAFVAKREQPEIAWTSTVNAIERALAIAGDQPVVVDDLKLGTVKPGDALRIVQNVCDGTGRDRLQSDGQRGASFHGRAILISTAEDFLESEPSAYGRSLVVELKPGDVDGRALAEDEEWGENARIVIAHYALWLSSDFEARIGDGQRYAREAENVLKHRAPDIAHPRMYETGSVLLGSFRLFLDFVSEHSDIDIEAEMKDHCDAVADLLVAMGSVVTSARVGETFVRDLRSLFFAGKVRIKNLSNSSSGNAPLVGFIEHPEVNDGTVYIDPGSVWEALRLIRTDRTRSTWTSGATGRALRTEGYLVRWDPGQTTVKKQWTNRSRPRMWAIKLDRFLEE